ncbi:uncharacterized protein LOC111103245 [Crassostrea virginica]
MQLNICLFLFLFIAGICSCLEEHGFLQRLIDQLEQLGNNNRRPVSEETGYNSDSGTSGLQDPEKSKLQKNDVASQKSLNYEGVLQELRKLLLINKRDHVMPAVDLSHFSCTQEYYGLRKLVDNLAKKYCVVKDDHVHDSMDGL